MEHSNARNKTTRAQKTIMTQPSHSGNKMWPIIMHKGLLAEIYVSQIFTSWRNHIKLKLHYGRSYKL